MSSPAPDRLTMLALLQDTSSAMNLRRARVLQTVRDSGRALTPYEVGDILNIHTNTARDHLQALADSGHLKRIALSRQGRGRPAAAYAAPGLVFHNPQIAMATLMINLLLNHLQDVSPVADLELQHLGEKMGRHLGHYFTSSSSVLDQIFHVLDQWGYDPEIPVDLPDTLVLRTNPLENLPFDQPDTVRLVLISIIRGILDECGLPGHTCTVVGPTGGSPITLVLPKDTGQAIPGKPLPFSAQGRRASLRKE